jgi:hypothetical protein
MTATKRPMPVGLWVRLMVRLWLTTVRLRIAHYPDIHHRHEHR